MEFSEYRHEVRQDEDNQDRADREGQHQDCCWVDHCAAKLLERGVLTLEVCSPLGEHPVERAAVFGGTDHVDVQLVKDLGMVADRNRERLAYVQVLDDI